MSNCIAHDPRNTEETVAFKWTSEQIRYNHLILTSSNGQQIRLTDSPGDCSLGADVIQLEMLKDLQNIDELRT